MEKELVATRTPTEHLLAVADTVCSGLTFDMRYSIDEHPERGNCFEFAMRTHDVLAETPGQHYVVFTFDHAFNYGANSQGLYFVSSNVPEFAASEADAPSMREMFAPDVSAAVRNGTLQDEVVTLARMESLKASLSAAVLDRSRQYKRWYNDAWLAACSPAAAIMEVGFAREALTNYFEFRRGVYRADFEGTRRAIELLRVRTPQHETRPQYNEELATFERALQRMHRKGISTRDLASLIVAYEEILPETNTAANVVFGDCFRRIHSLSGSANARAAAEQRYKRAGEYSYRRRGRKNPLVESKLGKLAAYSPQI